LHLGHSYYLGDLRLAHVLEEPHVEHLLIALRQLLEDRFDHPPLFRIDQGLVLVGERVHHGGSGIVTQRRVERHRSEGLAGAHRLLDLLGGHVDVFADLFRRGGATQRLGQSLAFLGDEQHRLLEAPGHLERPGRVPQVLLQLAADRLSGEGRELHLAGGIEAVYRRHQRHVGDLVEVGALAGATVAAGDGPGEALVAGKDLVAGVTIHRDLFPQVHLVEVRAADSTDEVDFEPGGGAGRPPVGDPVEDPDGELVGLGTAVGGDFYARRGRRADDRDRYRVFALGGRGYELRRQEGGVDRLDG